MLLLHFISIVESSSTRNVELSRHSRHEKISLPKYSLVYFLCLLCYEFVILSTSIHKNNETNDKFYRKVAFRKWLILHLQAEKQLRN